MNKIGVPNKKNRSLIFGKGINDYHKSTVKDGKRDVAYVKWHNLMMRCYSKSWKRQKPSYDKCLVCKEWWTFSNFKKWFDEHYIEGYQLDKDILVKGNKIYSPDTCCFVPPRINYLLISRKRDRGKYPIGVHFHNGKYSGGVNMEHGKIKYTGLFNTPEEAFYAYKKIKEVYIKEVARTYYKEKKITQRVYNALMKYEVEITD